MKSASKIVLSVLFILLSISAFSQDLPPEDEVPVDGGISVLVAFVLAWGIKRIRNEGK